MCTSKCSLTLYPSLSFSLFCLLSQLIIRWSFRQNGFKSQRCPQPSLFLFYTLSLFSSFFLCLCFSSHRSFIFVFDTLIAPQHLHLAFRSPAAPPPMMFCRCSLQGLCGGPGLSLSICSHIMESVSFGEALCLVFLHCFESSFMVSVWSSSGAIMLQYSYHNIITSFL